MKRLTVEQHRKRIENMHRAEEKVQKFNNKIRFHNYIPGHVVYNMGPYPYKVDMAPTEYDYRTLQQLRDDGYQWIQWHSDGIDWLRLHGGDTFMNGDVEGSQKFIDLAHFFGHKIVPYISPAFYPVDDPEFQEAFTNVRRAFESTYFYLCSGSHGSPEWREFCWRKTFDVMDRFDFDGIYADFGYDKFLARSAWEWDHYGNAENSHYAPLEYDPEVEDYLGMIYAELNGRGLQYKIHLGCFQPPPVKEKVYDYLWVGEAGRNVKDILMCKNYEPFMVPAFDRNTAPLPDPEMAYTMTIPFAQFPILYYGRPKGTKDKTKLTGLKCYRTPPEKDIHYEWYKDHPDGPYVYSEWSSIPDDPDEYERSAKYLKLYKPMVEEGSVAQIEIRESSLITSSIPEDVYSSMFTNEEQYLVVGNTTEGDYTITLTDDWTDRQTGKTGKEFTVAKDRLLFLIRAE